MNKQVVYTIEVHGDDLEQRFHPRLASLFPNYEEFWREVVVPSTMREIDGTLGLRPGVAKDFELLAMSHYSCYCHLGIAHGLLDAVEEKPYLYDDFFFHIHAAMEMVSRKIRKNENLKEDNAFLRYCAGIRAEIYPPAKSQSEYDAFADSLGSEWKTRKSAFDTLALEVSRYRNAFTHDPRMGQFVHNGRRWIPRHENLAGVLRWSEVALLPFSEEFVDLSELAQRLMREAPTSVDSLWPELIAEFKPLAATDKYQEMTRTGRYAPAKHQSFGKGESPPSTDHSATVLTTVQTASGVHSTSGSGIFVPRIHPVQTDH